VAGAAYERTLLLLQVWCRKSWFAVRTGWLAGMAVLEPARVQRNQSPDGMMTAVNSVPGEVVLDYTSAPSAVGHSTVGVAGVRLNGRAGLAGGAALDPCAAEFSGGGPCSKVLLIWPVQESSLSNGWLLSPVGLSVLPCVVATILCLGSSHGCVYLAPDRCGLIL
jgi:hypothetical protein